VKALPGINNVNSSYNPEVKRVSSKLNFQLGEIFAARVVSTNESYSEILLKLIDGWQFSAQLERPLDFLPKDQLKFKVVGYEEGKLVLKLLENTEAEGYGNYDILSKIQEDNNLTYYEKDLLEKMLKHDMPLTRENITKVKSLIDYLNKVKLDPMSIDGFILKYINAKSISANSEEGINISQKLRNFFNSIGRISEEDLLTLIENGVEVNTENIDSYIRVFKENSGLYESLKDMNTVLANYKESEGRNSIAYKNKSELQYTDGVVNMNEQLNINDKEELSDSSNLKIVERREITPKTYAIYDKRDKPEGFENKIGLLKFLADSELDGQSSAKNTLQNVQDEDHIKNSIMPLSSKDEDSTLIITVEKENNKLAKALLSEVNSEVNPDTELIKRSIKEKTEEIKNIVKAIFSLKNSGDSEVISRIADTIKPGINDIKLFNTISNQYYYMDVPLDIKENKYNCKLIIKDERRKGKKIDSKNVTIVVSLSTVNIGVVDGFIKVRDNNMNVDIKCDRAWISSLESKKEKLLNKLSLLGYNLFVNFLEREKELDISSCREFFNDNSFTNLNVKV
jgi:hypothetical protein